MHVWVNVCEAELRKIILCVSMCVCVCWHMHVSPFLCAACGSMANMWTTVTLLPRFCDLTLALTKADSRVNTSFLSLLCSCFINHQHCPKHLKTLQISSESPPRQSVFAPLQYCLHPFLPSGPLLSSPKPTSSPLKRSPQNFPVISLPYQTYSYLRNVSCLLLEYWDWASGFLCPPFLLLAAYLAILFC